jgi:GNAT superfamily N-acetyltransferase
MTVTFQTESFEGALEELKPLLRRHYTEIATFQDEIEYDPDWDTYVSIEQMGKLLFYTARADGVLIGYILGFVMPHMHNKSTLHFTCDIYYVEPEHRKSGTGFRFFTSHDAHLKTLGVRRSIMGTKNTHNHEKLFTALGYVIEDVIMVKLL